MKTATIGYGFDLKDFPSQLGTLGITKREFARLGGSGDPAYRKHLQEWITEELRRDHGVEVQSFQNWRGGFMKDCGVDITITGPEEAVNELLSQMPLTQPTTKVDLFLPTHTWHIRLVRSADGTYLTPYEWLVRVNNPDPQDSWEEAVALIKKTDMLPTDHCDPQGNLLPGLELTPEIVEWEGNNQVARLF